MRIRIVHNLRQVIGRLRSTIRNIPANIRKALGAVAPIIVRSARMRLAVQDPTLAPILVPEIRSDVVEQAAGAVAEIGFLDASDEIQGYARAIEEGYSVPAMTIYARYKKALSFTWKKGAGLNIRGLPTMSGPYIGHYAFHHVNRPAYTVAARPFLEPAVREAHPVLRELLGRMSIRVGTQR